jgi:hypothetical protein
MRHIGELLRHVLGLAALIAWILLSALLPFIAAMYGVYIGISMQWPLWLLFVLIPIAAGASAVTLFFGGLFCFWKAASRLLHSN